MKAQANTKHGQSQNGDIREIPKWTRRYAQHRTLPVLANFLLFGLFYVGIGGLSYLAGVSYRAGHMVRFGVCISVLLPILITLVWFSLPWCGGKRLMQFYQRLYRKEGYAIPLGFGPEDRRGRPWWAIVAAFGFGACIASSVVFGVLGYLPREYMQPISAIYVVPFLVFLTVWLRLGFCAWLYPFLYGLHAILYLAGAPIRFSGRLQGLNILIPVTAYGMLAALVGHIYSRFALRKLKKLTHVTADGAASAQEG